MSLVFLTPRTQHLPLPSKGPLFHIEAARVLSRQDQAYNSSIDLSGMLFVLLTARRHSLAQIACNSPKQCARLCALRSSHDHWPFLHNAINKPSTFQCVQTLRREAHSLDSASGIARLAAEQACAHDEPAPGTPLQPARLHMRAPLAVPNIMNLPQPDSNGATVGIPMPMQAMPRHPGGSTLPPMPAASAHPAQPLSSDSTPCATPPRPSSSGTHSTAPDGSKAQYRRIFIPTTVHQNGVTTQLLVPTMCLMAPGTGSSPLRSAPLSMHPLQPLAANSCSPSAPNKQPAARKGAAPLRARGKLSRESSPLGPAYVPLQKKSQQKRYGTRASALPSAAAHDTGRQVQKGGADALDMLADAALLDM